MTSGVVHWRYHTAGEPIACSVCGRVQPASSKYWVRWRRGVSDADEAVCGACQPTVDLDDLDEPDEPDEEPEEDFWLEFETS